MNVLKNHAKLIYTSTCASNARRVPFLEDDYFQGLLACTVVCRAILGFESHDKAGIHLLLSP